MIAAGRLVHWLTLATLVLGAVLGLGCTATVCAVQRVPYTDADGTTLWTITTCYPHVPVGGHHDVEAAR